MDVASFLLSLALYFLSGIDTHVVRVASCDSVPVLRSRCHQAPSTPVSAVCKSYLFVYDLMRIYMRAFYVKSSVSMPSWHLWRRVGCISTYRAFLNGLSDVCGASTMNVACLAHPGVAFADAVWYSWRLRRAWLVHNAFGAWLPYVALIDVGDAGRHK